MALFGDILLGALCLLALFLLIRSASKQTKEAPRPRGWDTRRWRDSERLRNPFYPKDEE